MACVTNQETIFCTLSYCNLTYDLNHSFALWQHCHHFLQGPSLEHNKKVLFTTLIVDRQLTRYMNTDSIMKQKHPRSTSRASTMARHISLCIPYDDSHGNVICMIYFYEDEYKFMILNTSTPHCPQGSYCVCQYHWQSNTRGTWQNYVLQIVGSHGYNSGSSMGSHPCIDC